MTTQQGTISKECMNGCVSYFLALSLIRYVLNLIFYNNTFISSGQDFFSLKLPSQERKINRRIAARLLHQIRQKSGGRSPNKHSWSAHPLLIRLWPEHFNSQLNFAGWSADVTQLIHRPASHGTSPSHLLASARRPVGIWGVIGGKKPTGGRTDICRSSSGCRTVTQGWSASNLDMESHLTVTARPPAGVHRETAGSSLDTLILSAVISTWRDLWDVMKTTMGYKN